MYQVSQAYFIYVKSCVIHQSFQLHIYFIMLLQIRLYTLTKKYNASDFIYLKPWYIDFIHTSLFEAKLFNSIYFLSIFQFHVCKYRIDAQFSKKITYFHQFNYYYRMAQVITNLKVNLKDSICNHHFFISFNYRIDQCGSRICIVVYHLYNESF